MNCTITYDCWQMECCGTPFSVGDTVKWFVEKYEKIEQLNSPDDSWKTDYYYEAHSSDWQGILVLEGKVQTIKILYQKYMPSEEHPRLLVPVSGKTVEAEHVEGFEAKLDDMIPSAYIVDITEYTVRPVIRQAEEERLDLT